MAKRKRLINDRLAIAKAVGKIVGKKIKVDTKTRQPALLEDPPEAKFTLAEKKLLINAFNQNGFHIFHDIPYLMQLLPLRSETEIRTVIEGLRRKAAVSNELDDSDQQTTSALDQWQKLCSRLTNVFTKKINLSEIYVDCFNRFAATWNDLGNDHGPERVSQSTVEESGGHSPDYKSLYLNFAQLLSGKFPEKMSSVDSYIALKVFEDISNTISRLNVDLSEISNGNWARDAETKANKDLNSAIITLEKMTTSIQITSSDISDREEIRQLFREFPKIKRITDTMNPLQMHPDITQSIRIRLNDHSLDIK